MPSLTPVQIAQRKGIDVNATRAEYDKNYGTYRNLLKSLSKTGLDQERIYQQPGVRQAYDAANKSYSTLVSGGVPENSIQRPTFYSGNGKNGFINKIASVALPAAGAFLGGPVGAAAGSAVASKANHASWGEGLKNAGLSAAMAAIGGQTGKFVPSDSLVGSANSSLIDFASPVGNLFKSATDGLSGALKSTTGLSTGSGLTGDFARGVTGAAGDSPITSAARQAISGSATSASGGGLANYLPSASGAVSGGGSTGGFFSGITDFAKGITTDPVGTITDSIKSGAEDMFKPASLIKSGLKGGLSLALQKDNSRGYEAVQRAAEGSAANFQPFLDSGTAANSELSDLQGLNGPEAQAAAMARFHADPGYNFARDEGIKALDASAASRGMLRSGNQQRAVQTYGTGLADQYFKQYLDRLAGTAGKGQEAATGVGDAKLMAANVFGAMKKNKADNFNQVLGGLASFL
jgi:hypothetical protein